METEDRPIVAEVRENEKGELTIQLPADFIRKTGLKNGQDVAVSAQPEAPK